MNTFARRMPLDFGIHSGHGEVPLRAFVVAGVGEAFPFRAIPDCFGWALGRLHRRRPTDGLLQHRGFFPQVGGVPVLAQLFV